MISALLSPEFLSFFLFQFDMMTLLFSLTLAFSGFLVLQQLTGLTYILLDHFCNFSVKLLDSKLFG